MLCYLRYPGRPLGPGEQPPTSVLEFVSAQVDLFDRLVGAMFRKAEARHARAFQADARAINEKVRLYARVGVALITARDGEQDAYDAIAKVIPWERFRSTVAEAEALARPEECDTLEKLGEHYAGIRRWSSAFLAALEFEGVPTCASLMRAITVLREANGSGDDLPKSAPTGFVRQRWAIRPAGRLGRPAPLRAVRANARQGLLDERLQVVAPQAAAGALPDVTITNGVLSASATDATDNPRLELMHARYAPNSK